MERSRAPGASMRGNGDSMPARGGIRKLALLHIRLGVASERLQLIRDIGITAEEYVVEHFHTRISPPDSCPHCGRQKALWALCYYPRNVTQPRSGSIRLMIRRFRCWRCKKTVSILPAFAQPYRFVQNHIIGKFADGERDPEVMRWIVLLRQYWARFVMWLPELRRAVVDGNVRGPPEQDAVAWWQLLVSPHGDFTAATMASVSRFRITFFGRYRCHEPRPSGV